MTMTEAPAVSAKQESMIDKIKGMTAKLEDPATTEEERETARGLIARLMAKYDIDQARIDAARSKGQKQALVEENVFEKKSSWSACYRDLLSGLSRASDIKLVLTDHKYGEKAGGTTYHLLGFEHDTEQALVLFHSLKAQAADALAKFARTNYAPSWATAGDKYKIRRDFLFGYFSAALVQINKVRAEVLEEEKVADQQIADRLVANHEPSDAPAGAELVLATKRERVEEFVSEKYPRLGVARGGNVQRGYGNGYAAGADQGRRANVGGRKGISASGPAGIK